MYSELWGGRDRWFAGAVWPVSLVYLASSRLNTEFRASRLINSLAVVSVT